MARFVINGGRKLSGQFTPAGNKNAALPMLSAALLTEEEVTIRNVPLIEDVSCMLEILSDLGVQIEVQDNTVRVCAKNLSNDSLNSKLCGKARSSILFAGPMLARCGSVVLDPPGGDVIGRRRLDTHFAGLRALGVEIDFSDRYYFKCNKLVGVDILLDEASVTATENIVMASVLAAGRTTIFNAACEPHVVNLGEMLIGMGAEIEGLGTNRIVIHGVDRLGGVTCKVEPDHIETGSFVIASAVTGGRLEVLNVDPLSVAPLITPLKTIGIELELSDDKLTVDGTRPKKIKYDFGVSVPRIADGVWPSFPSDMMSVAIVAATQAEGTILFFERLFESRMYFVDRLIEMGAQIIQCDPHRVIVAGPSKLRGSRVTSPDIRAGMAMLIAALCAEGTSVIENAQVIDRGYEKIEMRLTALGADIIRED
ncbi:MAG: UDP-N-acetylglucosamine 1-carboxyvinyltransferase [Lentisphaerae bacterium]|nr:UDP-N-acetylglucosamine 1-carboxyvinyltransferase [Lentisphaerota bacterium]